MLMRTDPFRELDRFAQQVLGTAARPAVMPMDAWREGEEFVVEFDLPGINADSLDIDIERNVVTVRAERPAVDPNREMLATDRPRGVFSRQFVLGENLDTERIEASYNEGVLRLHIPVAKGQAAQDFCRPRRRTQGHQRQRRKAGGRRRVISDGRGDRNREHSGYWPPNRASVRDPRCPPHHPGADIALHQQSCGKTFEPYSALNPQRHLCRHRRFASFPIYPDPSGSDGAHVRMVSLAR